MGRVVTVDVVAAIISEVMMVIEVKVTVVVAVVVVAVAMIIDGDRSSGGGVDRETYRDEGYFE